MWAKCQEVTWGHPTEEAVVPSPWEGLLGTPLLTAPTITGCEYTANNADLMLLMKRQALYPVLSRVRSLLTPWTVASEPSVGIL